MSIAQLNSARELVRTNPEQYPTLIKGILKVGDRPETEIRAWSAGFVTEFFASDAVSDSEKNQTIQEVLTLVPQWIKDENSTVAKLGICVLCEIYPRIYQRTIVEGNQIKTLWDIVQVLKTMVLARWVPNAPESITVMCIKLAQVLITTHRNVPANHIVLDSVTLTAESAGLLDRITSVFSAKSPISFGVLSASVNVSMAIALSDKKLAPRIIGEILKFNLNETSLEEGLDSPLVLKWVNKLFKLALYPLQKYYTHIPVFLEGMQNYCNNQSLKRHTPDSEDKESTETNFKRQKIEDTKPTQLSYKELYTLSNTLASVTAQSIQLDLAASIAIAGLEKIDSAVLDASIAKVMERLNEANKPTVLESEKVSTEPVNAQAEPESQEPPQEEEEHEEPVIQKGPTRAALEVEVPPEFKQYDIILNRLLTDAPERVVARLSARGLGGFTPIKEFTQKKLYAQFVTDFRNSLEPLVLWLSEEYYADEARDNYFKLVSRVVDEIIPKLEVADSKLFVRLLSELPELNREIIFKIRSSCLDPERSLVGARALKFLIMFKPPCREDCLDLVSELVKEGVQSVKGILERYRPQEATA